ncbi:50S ribosomal protein L3 N(5)-glutamine methyltransferase [Ketobacter sp. MCCC 1A13808]|uniref:50S ribosomal protein L3 N(5)-glutamine methyltransferase n=1 Tax=Ketobacter sp. MCCC 1A13808 TaxID=2602738 RepID=UPI000F10C864|nr:50S ribosomal protein L3 N(5)-glutamine methyltransferase [Ketobacter sp. MCCC 1A13808]MVF12478.1 50S ribosomal protein L3 N(5)-glutamine methyltransferase [Ketobacter sp. MCCC 1A13808]RLP55713.1 MAG: 50S ribosomal protein L3 N(5)-glutamine methyltransferase [Ketobacter sp.]
MTINPIRGDLINLEEALQELHTIRDFLRWSVSLFNEHQVVQGHGYADAWDEAVALVLHALHLPWDIDTRIQDARLLTSEKEAVCALLEKRVVERIPTAYLTGTGWFAEIPFKVDQRVLIPRSPIAELIEKQFAPWVDPDQVDVILDMCAGSGCIGIACAHYFPQALVDCVDLSEDALDVAEQNVLSLGVEHQVNVIYSDLFEALEGRTYDIIVSNPPYVDKADMDSLPDEFHHEPRMGLEAGNDGLDIVRRMLPELSRHLNPGGIVVIEVGNSWEALEVLYENVAFTWLEFERGGHGVFLLTKEEIDHQQAEFVL